MMTIDMNGSEALDPSDSGTTSDEHTDCDFSPCPHEKHECPADGTDSRGRCLGNCYECGEHLLATGRHTTYCPSCDVCPDCKCPNADGFAHNLGCTQAETEAP